MYLFLEMFFRCSIILAAEILENAVQIMRMQIVTISPA